MTRVPGQSGDDVNDYSVLPAEPVRSTRKGPILLAVVLLIAAGAGVGIWLTSGSGSTTPPSGSAGAAGGGGPTIRPVADRLAFYAEMAKLLQTHRDSHGGRLPAALTELTPQIPPSSDFGYRSHETLYRLDPRSTRAQPTTIVACDAPGYYESQRCVLYADGRAEALDEKQFDAALSQPENAAMRSAVNAAYGLGSAAARHPRQLGLSSAVSMSCKTRLHAIGQGLKLYELDSGGPPAPDLLAPVERDYLSAKALLCPASAKGGMGYFYYPVWRRGRGDAVVACDFRGNHEGQRNVLMASGAVTEMSEADFATEMARPTNAAFAAALQAFGGP